MIVQDKIQIRNYKCFDENGVVCFNQIMPINIIIGKNNSGKSSLIDLVEVLNNNNQEFFQNKRNGLFPEINILHKLKEDEIGLHFKVNTNGGGLKNHFEYGKRFINKTYTYTIKNGGQAEFKEIDEDYLPAARKHLQGIVRSLPRPLNAKFFCKITAEREIKPEGSNNTVNISSNGFGATNLIQEFINKADKDSHLIERKLLKDLNQIINPDIHFSRILVQQIKNVNQWEIYFEDLNDNRIALSKMGSGIKTILLVLLNIIVQPILKHRKIDDFIFAFEELENNLHPSLQRRLYQYIKKVSEESTAYFFITTHSNIIIDAFGTYDRAQMLHIMNDGFKSSVKTVLSLKETKKVLQDLDIRASDLLQSNGIIWVEGPSDRHYINKWLELVAPELREGLDYSIMFYGGRLLANLTFDYEWLDNQLIPLLRINTNAYVVIDRDGKTINSKLNNTKKRINEEIGENHCWITKGREIENYLGDKYISEWLSKKLKSKVNYSNFSNDKDIKLEDNISSINKKIKLRYNTSKTAYSKEICAFLDEKSLDVLDLKIRLNELVRVIQKWNSK